MKKVINKVLDEGSNYFHKLDDLAQDLYRLTKDVDADREKQLLLEDMADSMQDLAHQLEMVLSEIETGLEEL